MEATPHFEPMDMSSSFLVQKQHHNIILVHDYRTAHREYEYGPKDPVIDISQDKNAPVIRLD